MPGIDFIATLGATLWVVDFRRLNSSPFRFFALVFVLSIPFWLYGAFVSTQLLPGLPVSALMAICPGVVAGILVFRSGGPGLLSSFLRRIGDFGRMRPWAWLVSLGTMPVVMVLSAAILVLMGKVLPPFEIGLMQTIGLFALFFVAATAEELGWTAYATGPLVKKQGLIVAGLILGGVSVVWHLIPLLQADRAWDWIVWWAIGTVARRIIIVWLYVRGGQSVFSASLFHAMNNLSWMLFPVMGSHYDPVSTALLSTALSALVVGRVRNTRDLT
jgi:membrane protease YdiL (CAAX protease family)